MELLIPQVSLEQAEKFAKVWTLNGISLPLEKHHIQFARDFANITLRSFVIECQERAQKAFEAMEKEGGEDERDAVSTT